MDSGIGGQSSDFRQRQTASDIARRKVLAAYSARRNFSSNAIAHSQTQAARRAGPPVQTNFQHPTPQGRPSNFTAAPTYIEPTQYSSSTTITINNHGENPANVSNVVVTQASNTPKSGDVQVNHGTNTYTSATQTPPQTYTDTAAHDQNSEIGSYKQAPVSVAKNPQVDFQKYHSAWQSYYQKYYSEYYAKAARQYVETERLKTSRKASDEQRNNSEPTERDHRNYVKQELSDATVDKVEATLRERIQQKADGRFHLKKKHRKLIPIMAGVSVILVVLFLQYNRLIFTPIMAYIAPGNTSDTGITAIDPTVTTNVSDQNKLYIPKLNVETPVAFGIGNDTDTLNAAMMNGVAHFRVPNADAFPGDYGNTVISGHSSGDIYSGNQYKFIFSGLERLVTGDLIYIDYDKVRYTYTVTGTKVVEPNDVASLNLGKSKRILTLITCTPLGTSRYRLLVFADQVSPTKDKEEDSHTDQSEIDPNAQVNMPSNEKTFFETIFH